ncbi:hypothetical protein RJC98_08620 [Pseudomonas allii]|uniref:Uncharacterized protein n=1 Tax=Pseudomonas allii TaxID=2740531 RepID=A0ACC6LAB2_9PSED|nr:hypothetical protein [Pseudomonas allii]MDR9875243.1 hypothetical protein [Pseudomonas allii]
MRRSPNIPLISGTSSVAHLHENLALGELTVTDEVFAELNAIAG